MVRDSKLINHIFFFVLVQLFMTMTINIVRDQLNSRFHGHDIFREIDLLK